MSKLKMHFFPLCLMLSIPLLHSFYELLNNGDRGARSLITSFDQQIPFIEAFIIPYVFWYIFIFGMLFYFFVYDRSLYYKTLLSLTTGMVICYVIYFFFQTTVPRPPLDGNSIFTSMIRYIYSADEPYNCFPSIHVLSSYLMVIASRHCKTKTPVFVASVALIGYLIIFSTLFVKQHVILDAFAGILLGNILFNSIFYFKPILEYASSKKYAKNKKAAEPR
ncbi:phosphatase PAP2 family protein [Fictibacillus enclensis]|uniref:phosphatase PAP2 family protein n=1 Tax=Fictibacillus enclensis TaxID=1017270 RepID=UPI0024C05127|nr:phosphatase PAP2 family protein [Fictibacillus enclensis]MDM5197790.1 phosphatase PAP2 family protein [Fictibacillus enclensis]MDM5336943.1 phosphatase PAP2 family protein [Fictibacillus enclensis]WHY73365.1 phosphatase PAP2 family protein [Fictibacillus enclensis]